MKRAQKQPLSLVRAKLEELNPGLFTEPQLPEVHKVFLKAEVGETDENGVASYNFVGTSDPGDTGVEKDEFIRLSCGVLEENAEKLGHVAERRTTVPAPWTIFKRTDPYNFEKWSNIAKDPDAWEKVGTDRNGLLTVEVKREAMLGKIITYNTPAYVRHAFTSPRRYDGYQDKWIKDAEVVSTSTRLFLNEEQLENIQSVILRDYDRNIGPFLTSETSRIVSQGGVEVEKTLERKIVDDNTVEDGEGVIDDILSKIPKKKGNS